MQRASYLFSAEDRCRVTDAIVQAERRSTIEIMPVVATASGRYDRAEDVAGLWASFITLGVLWYAWPPLPREPHAWGEMSPAGQLALYIAAMLLAFFLGAILASRIGWLRRLFTPAEQMRDEVRQRAQSVFFDQRLHHTASGGGLLVYISLFEHQAVILADQRVLTKIEQSTVDRWCQELTDSLRHKYILDALCETLEHVAVKLAEVLPRTSDDTNEIDDALIIID